MANDADNEAFDARMRALLNGLPTTDAPLAMPRRRFLRLGAGWAAGLAALGAGGWLGWRQLEPPALVQAALAHVAQEADLRGLLVPDPALVRAALGLPAAGPWPGILQLCKRCQVQGMPIWHVTVFLDQLGYVQILAFQHAVTLAERRGRWLRSHWSFLPERRILLISHDDRALARVGRLLGAQGSGA